MDLVADQQSPMLLLAASNGDVDAQAALVRFSYDRFHDGFVSFEHAVWVAEAWARLAAAHGRSAELRLLAKVLLDVRDVCFEAGEHRNADLYLKEAATLLDQLADAGDDESVALLFRLSEALGAAGSQEVADGVRAARSDEEGEA
jgi:hypothetical protein